MTTPHPRGRAAGDADVATAMALISAIAKSASRIKLAAAQGERPPTGSDFGTAARAVGRAWAVASPGGRRDALATCAYFAAEAMAEDPTRLTNPCNHPGPGCTCQGPDTTTVATWSRRLVMLASQDLAGGATFLGGEKPWLPAHTLCGTEAQALVDDTTITAAVKIAILAVLASLATLVDPAAALARRQATTPG